MMYYYGVVLSFISFSLRKCWCTFCLRKVASSNFYRNHFISTFKNNQVKIAGRRNGSKNRISFFKQIQNYYKFIYCSYCSSRDSGLRVTRFIAIILFIGTLIGAIFFGLNITHFKDFVAFGAVPLINHNTPHYTPIQREIKPYFKEDAPFPELPKTPELENLENETDPYYLLNHFSKKYGVDFELAYRIVECESNFDRYAKNGSSSAESYFQFIDKTFKETMLRMNRPTSTSKFDMPIAIEAGVWLLSQEGGEKHWDASKNCWL